MPGSLDHSPQEIIGQLLIDLSVGTDSQTLDWSVFIDSKPDKPDECLVVSGQANVLQMTSQPTGEIVERRGIQILARAYNQSTGWTKVNDLVTKLDTEVNRGIVVLGGTTYIVHSVDRTSGPFHVGRETPESKREIFTVNATCSIRQVI